MLPPSPFMNSNASRAATTFPRTLVAICPSIDAQPSPVCPILDLACRASRATIPTHIGPNLFVDRRVILARHQPYTQNAGRVGDHIQPAMRAERFIEYRAYRGRVGDIHSVAAGDRP